MRIAFVDLVYSWPPLGGAPLDLHHTILGLNRLGHDVHLFFGTDPQRWDRGTLDTKDLPFPATRIEFSEEEFTPDRVAPAYREAVDSWEPDVVFICFAFFMKPFIIDALSHHRTIGRYYAYEPVCPRDYRVFIDGKPCPQHYLKTPNVCRKCTMNEIGEYIHAINPTNYAKEFVATKAYSREFYERYIRTLDALDGIVVYSPYGKEQLEDYNDNIHIIGGGVNLEEFPSSPLPTRGENDKLIILMTGRSADPAKGAAVLRDATKAIYEERQDFELWVTSGGPFPDAPFVKDLGWRDHAGIVELYRQADICVVPSVWEEPFGLVAVEAMATGRPVCVARVGGLQHIPVHGETGYVYDRFDADALAGHLRTLMDDADLRRSMGEAGRKRIEDVYTWEKVIAKHYPPLLESVTS